MKYIANLRENMHVSEVYLCKTRQIMLTKNGKEYCSLTLQDKTGTLDGKIWDLGNPGIGTFEAHDYVAVDGDVTLFNGNPQLNIRRIRKADEDEYIPGDYLPVSTRDPEQMYKELLAYVDSVKNPYLNKLLKAFFVEDEKVIARFRFSSAAKTIHHSFVGGLMEHTLNVTNICDFFSKQYPVLNRDLLITAALCHDIGKTTELTPFPENDYSDEGQLIGHIVKGYEMIGEKIKGIEGFPEKLGNELRHCILAHHGELEYGSPKKPALAEAVAVNLADNADAKLESIREIFEAAGDNKNWLGFNRILDSNIRRTSI